MDELRIVAPFHERTGYSKHARALLRTALVAGYRVQAVESDYKMVMTCSADAETGDYSFSREKLPKHDIGNVPPVQQDELVTALQTEVAPAAPAILLQLPHMMNGWQEYSEGPRLGYTMVECDSLRPEIAKALRGVDMLLAPSKYVQQVFWGNVRRVPCHIMPDPVDDRLLPVGVSPMEIAERPKFLFVSVGTSHERKHWRELMHAFAEEFAGEDVGLLVKSNPSEDMQALAASCREFGAWVRVEDESWSDEEMAGLYAASDCFVGVGHEGFGLPFVEAGFYGKPSLALSVGGQADIVNWENGYPVRSVMTPCVGLIPRYFPSSANWATCSVRDLRSALRVAYEDDEGRRQRGEWARKTAERYTPENLAGRLIEVVEMAQDVWKWKQRVGA